MPTGVAGARVVGPHIARGTFERKPEADLQGRFELPKIDPDTLTTSLSSADSVYDRRKGEGTLHGALAPDDGRSGGLTGKARSRLEGDFVHVPGFAGHRPESWTSHYMRRSWGKQQGVHSKQEAHVTSWGRPAMDSGVGYTGNIRLHEGPPKVNPAGLFRTEIQDEIDRVAKSQVKQIGDTAYKSLRQDEIGRTVSMQPKQVSHEPQCLKNTLSHHPPGTRSHRADQKDLAIFQGTFPASRHIPGFDGHIPGGVRR